MGSMETGEEIDTICENLMNIVVESRKRFGKICMEYDQKTLLMENKLLNLRVESASNCRFMPKNPIPSVEDCNNDCNNHDDFLVEISETQKRVENLIRKLQDTHEVFLQLKGDGIGQKLRAPLTVNALLAQAKTKKI